MRWMYPTDPIDYNLEHQNEAGSERRSEWTMT